MEPEFNSLFETHMLKLPLLLCPTIFNTHHNNIVEFSFTFPFAQRQNLHLACILWSSPKDMPSLEQSIMRRDLSLALLCLGITFSKRFNVGHIPKTRL
jgi:hypothetical protein